MRKMRWEGSRGAGSRRQGKSEEHNAEAAESAEDAEKRRSGDLKAFDRKGRRKERGGGMRQTV
jgi:hypothetical protein